MVKICLSRSGIHLAAGDRTSHSTRGKTTARAGAGRPMRSRGGRTAGPAAELLAAAGVAIEGDDRVDPLPGRVRAETASEPTRRSGLPMPAAEGHALPDRHGFEDLVLDAAGDAEWGHDEGGLPQIRAGRRDADQPARRAWRRNPPHRRAGCRR